MKTTAFCWASGLIQFTTPKRRPRVPKGAIAIITGDDRDVRRIIQVSARLAYKTRPHERQRYLVPGLPEASMMGWKPEDKLEEFISWVRPKLNRRAA